MPPINWLAVVVCTVVAFVEGGLWYGPLFGKIWMREMNIGPDHKPKIGKPVLFGTTIVLTFIAAAVFAAFVGPQPGPGLAIGAGISTGVFWVGFSMTITYMFAGRSRALWAIDAGFAAVQFTLFGVVFALMG
jgi:hypothetical protein